MSSVNSTGGLEAAAAPVTGMNSVFRRGYVSGTEFIHYLIIAVHELYGFAMHPALVQQCAKVCPTYLESAGMVTELAERTFFPK